MRACSTTTSLRTTIRTGNRCRVARENVGTPRGVNKKTALVNNPPFPNIQHIIIVRTEPEEGYVRDRQREDRKVICYSDMKTKSRRELSCNEDPGIPEGFKKLDVVFLRQSGCCRWIGAEQKARPWGRFRMICCTSSRVRVRCIILGPSGLGIRICIEHSTPRPKLSVVIRSSTVVLVLCRGYFPTPVAAVQHNTSRGLSNQGFRFIFAGQVRVQQ